MLLAIFIMLMILDFWMGYRGKQSKLLVVLNFIFMWVLISGYSEGIDIGNYRNDYDTLGKRAYISTFSDPGYAFVTAYLAKAGYTFFQFKKIATFVGLLLVYISIYRMLKWDMLIVLGAYLSYEIFLDTIQYRNFMGLVFVIFGASFLLENNLKGKIVYIICVMIGSLFHSVMVLCIIFVLKDNEIIFKYFKRIIGVVMTFLIVATIINDRKIPFLNTLLAIYYNVSGSISNGYFMSGGSLSFFLPVISTAVFLWTLSRYDRGCQIANEVYKIDYLSILFLPLCIMSFQWYRIIRNLNILNYIAVSELVRKNGKYILRKRNIFAILLFVLVFWNISDLFRFIGWESFSTVFTNNFFLEI